MTAYGTVTQFKTRTDRDETISAAWTTAIGEILDAVSRKIDNICKVPDSYFVATTDTTRHLSGKGNNFLKIPDCVDITTISVKVDYDDTAYVLWDTPSTMYAGDGDWYPIAGTPDKPIFDYTPYTYVVVDPNGEYSYFPRGHNFFNVEFVAKIGYSTVVPADIQEVCLAEAVVLTKRFQGVMDDNLTNADLGQLVYRIRMSELSRDARQFLLGGAWIKTLYSTQR